MSRKYWFWILVFFIMIVGVPFTSSSSADKTITLKLAHDAPSTHAWQLGFLKFAESVSKKTNGQVNIQIYPSAQLGVGREYMELCQKGVVDFGPVTAGVAGSFIPAMNFFNLPFMFKDRASVKEVYTGPLGRKLLDTAEKHKLKGLSLNTYCFRSPLNSKRPIKTVADFKGLKMRLMEVPIHMETFKALGSSPVAIPVSELYMALKMGAADGAENNFSMLSLLKLNEICKYYSTLPVFLSASVMTMSLKTWNEKLDASQKKAIMESVPVLDETINYEYDRLEEVHRKVFIQEGVNIYEGPFDMKSFRAAVKPVYDKWIPMLPPEAQEVVTELQKKWD